MNKQEIQDEIKKVEQQAERIAEIKERCEKATPGSWNTKEAADYSEIYDGESWAKALSPLALVGGGVEDAEFIAHSREDIPYLLDGIESLQAQLDESHRREARMENLWRSDFYV